MKSKTVLFLDVDGVICTDRAYYASGQDKDKSILRTWDPVSINLVSRLCQDFDLEVVVSSTWRQRYDVPLILLTHGFRGNFHKDDKTPLVARFSGPSRGEEIASWLEDHPEVKNFIILDDEYIGQKELQPYHVQTDSNDGILTKHYDQAVYILKRFNFDVNAALLHNAED